jgi:hypothetical protein
MTTAQEGATHTRQLAAFVRELWDTHGGEQTPSGARLALTLDDGDMLIVEERAGRRMVSLRYLALAPDGRRFCALEVLVYVHPDGGWIPYSIYRPASGAEKVYAEVSTKPARITVTDAANQQALARYCDGWSFHLRAQGWLEKGVVT